MIIRPALPVDVPAVLPMVRAIYDLHERFDHPRFGVLPDVLDSYAKWLPNRSLDPRSVFLVADDHGAVVAYLIATVEENIPVYEVTHYGFIHDIFVQPSHRGRGIGERMIEEAVRRFTAIGVRQIRLETAMGNDGARQLFESCGFRESSIEMMRELPGAPASAEILHITSSDEWDLALARGSYTAHSLFTEGFIHCSTREQLPATLERHFAGKRDLVILTIDPSTLQPPLRWEPAHGILFPHIFGPINLDAVTNIQELPNA